MRSPLPMLLATLLSVPLLLTACGDSPAKPAEAPAADEVDVSTPDTVVSAYIAAATKPDEEAMLALGTPEWREKERTWEKGFTYHIVKKGYKIKEKERRPVRKDDQGLFRISVLAEFTRPDGEKKDQGLSFTLKQDGDRYWITNLR